MTRAEDVLFHTGEGGWFVLSNEPPQLGGETPQFSEHLLSRMDLSKPIACLVLGLDPISGLAELLEELEGLLGVSPALLDASQPPLPELARVSLLILAGGTTQAWVERLNDSQLGQLVLSALSSGAILLALGPAAGALGAASHEAGSDQLGPGLGWLAGAVVLPGIDEPAGLEPVRRQLEQRTKSYALGLTGSALVAIGPDGEIDVWGEAKPIIILGSGWAEP